MLLRISFFLGWHLVNAAHVFYSAIGNQDAASVVYDDVSNYLVWGPWNEVGDVFASCEFFFENGQIGYMGGQRHADGSHSVIFSIWDDCKRYGSTTCMYPRMTALPASEHCERFGGEGHGAHCGWKMKSEFEVGTPYKFHVAVGASNDTGRLVHATVNGTLIGTIFLLNTNDTTTDSSFTGYGKLAPYARTFMEYWSGGKQAASFGWIGPFAQNDSVGPPAKAVADSAEGLPVNVSACFPAFGHFDSVKCGRGTVFFNASVELPSSFPERADGGYWLDLWNIDERLTQRNMEACAWSKDAGLHGNEAFFCGRRQSGLHLSPLARMVQRPQLVEKVTHI